MSPAPATTLARLGAIVGADHLLTEASQLARYAVDGVAPAAAARPGSTEEIAEVLRFAAAEKLAVIPTAGGSKLGIGMPPARYDLALDLGRMNRVLAYDPRDLTLGVEAGMGMAQLAEVLAEHKQFLPLLVPFTTQATIGGTIATGIDSPLRQYYGTARDFILGVEFVTGDGTVSKSGGRVVKNVAGYDLHRLMIGALGTLGVLTRINFRTFPVPPASRGFLATFPTFDAALELRHRIARSPLQPLTLEILSPQLAGIFSRRAPRLLGMNLGPPGPWLSTSEWTLAAGYGGNQQVLARHEKDLTRLAEETRATNSTILGDAERPLIWGLLRECISLLLDESPRATIVRAGVLPTDLGRWVNAVQQAAEKHFCPAVILARGCGVGYVALLPEGKPAESVSDTFASLSAGLAGVCGKIMEASAAAGGHATIPWCPTELKRRVNVWGTPRDDFDLMWKLKQVFDPQNILSPGRFMGGI